MYSSKKFKAFLIVWMIVETILSVAVVRLAFSAESTVILYSSASQTATTAYDSGKKQFQLVARTTLCSVASSPSTSVLWGVYGSPHIESWGTSTTTRKALVSWQTCTATPCFGTPLVDYPIRFINSVVTNATNSAAIVQTICTGVE